MARQNGSQYAAIIVFAILLITFLYYGYPVIEKIKTKKQSTTAIKQDSISKEEEIEIFTKNGGR